MAVKRAKLERPDINLEALLEVVGVLLGLLFVVVIYFLENPLEVSTIWGAPLVLFLAFCYGVGLTFIGYVVRLEVNIHLANSESYLMPGKVSANELGKVKERIRKSLQRSIALILLFAVCFGLFLIDLAAFAMSKFLYAPLSVLTAVIATIVGEAMMPFVYVLVMFMFQLILLIPFVRFFGGIWASYAAIANPRKPEEKKNPSSRHGSN
jgi:hypothetical protein